MLRMHCSVRSILLNTEAQRLPNKILSDNPHLTNSLVVDRDADEGG